MSTLMKLVLSMTVLTWLSLMLASAIRTRGWGPGALVVHHIGRDGPIDLKPNGRHVADAATAIQRTVNQLGAPVVSRAYSQKSPDENVYLRLLR